jgi:hypothetical protein
MATDHDRALKLFSQLDQLVMLEGVEAPEKSELVMVNKSFLESLRK